MGNAPESPVVAAPAVAAHDQGIHGALAETERYIPTSGIAVENTRAVVPALVSAIVGARDWLSEIDGKIGDGDHGINMAKGFARCGHALGDAPPTMEGGLRALSDALMAGIEGLAKPLAGVTYIDAHLFGLMLDGAEAGIRSLGNADVGDKTLMDTLVPAVKAYHAAEGQGLKAALAAMSVAAEHGRDSTRDLVARIGRASRLGERSRGVLDAGATSCCLILQTLAASLSGIAEA